MTYDQKNVNICRFVASFMSFLVINAHTNMQKNTKHNPSVRVLAGILASEIKTNIKPLVGLGNVSKEELSHIDKDIHNVEKWLCEVNNRVTNSFVCEFNNYAAKVLNSVNSFKLYGYIKHHKLIMNSDKFNITSQEIADELDINLRAAQRALKELKQSEIIYKTDYKDTYYINVLVVFKGNLAKFIKNKKNNFYVKLTDRKLSKHTKDK